MPDRNGQYVDLLRCRAFYSLMSSLVFYHMHTQRSIRFSQGIFNINVETILIRCYNSIDAGYHKSTIIFTFMKGNDSMAHDVYVSSENSAKEERAYQSTNGRKRARVKCIIAVCIAAVMVTAFVSACTFTPKLVFSEVYSADGSEIIGYSVRLNENAEETDVVKIPAKHKNKPVCKIEKDAFRGCRSLKSITIPDSVTSIGQSAFKICRESKTAIHAPHPAEFYCYEPTEYEQWDVE